MSIFFRIDNDSIPDTQSYYDDGFHSSFPTREMAIESLKSYYLRHARSDEKESIGKWIEDNVIETVSGVWEGIEVNDLSPIRKITDWDGDMFIPKRMIGCWQIPPTWDNLEIDEGSDENNIYVLVDWIDGRDFSKAPWEGI